MIDLNLRPCEPPVWARTGHRQTILGHILPSPKLRTKGRRLEIILPDGDRLVGFIQDGTTSTVVYIFHGLAGSTDGTYMHRTSIVAQKLGHTVVMFNHRGCGEGVGLAKLPYHSGRGEDIAAVVAEGRRLFPRHRHIVIGFSMSANATLCLLTGLRPNIKSDIEASVEPSIELNIKTALPDLAIAINGPIDLASCAYLLSKGLNRIYDARFYRQCRVDVLLGGAPDNVKKRLPQLTTLTKLDSLYTAPMGGFQSRDHYYSECSTAGHLDKIKIPTVILTTADDPFVPVSAYREAQLSPHVHMHIEPHGGHMGYLSRDHSRLGYYRWQDYAIEQVLIACDK